MKSKTLNIHGLKMYSSESIIGFFIFPYTKKENLRYAALYFHHEPTKEEKEKLNDYEGFFASNGVLGLRHSNKKIPLSTVVHETYHLLENYKKKEKRFKWFHKRYKTKEEASAYILQYCVRDICKVLKKKGFIIQMEK